MKCQWSLLCARPLGQTIVILGVWIMFNILLLSKRDANISVNLAYNVLKQPSWLQNDLIIKDIPSNKKEDMLGQLAIDLPNLPLVYLLENKDKKWHLHEPKKKGCAKFPPLWDLHFNNLYWQKAEVANVTFYLYGAYLDRRENNRLGPTINILTMTDTIKLNLQAICQIWFEGEDQPVIVSVQNFMHNIRTGPDSRATGAAYLSCQLPQSHRNSIPISVSVVESKCDQATNNLRVTYNPLKEGEKKKKFAVCVKGLDFPDKDISERLMEWIELLNILGAEKVFIYTQYLHPNITKVLDDFVSQDKVHITPISLPGHYPNFQMLQHLFIKHRLRQYHKVELTAYHDCFYRNMYEYKFITLLDIDEVIMPLQRTNWAGMMEDAVRGDNNETRSFYSFGNMLFLDDMPRMNEDLPSHLHMLRHIYRSQNATDKSVRSTKAKSFFNTEEVETLWNHYPTHCLHRRCKGMRFNIKMAQLQHYRGDCYRHLKHKCKDIKDGAVLDDNIYRFREELVSRTSMMREKLWGI